jgi:hypothetical protein
MMDEGNVIDVMVTELCGKVYTLSRKKSMKLRYITTSLVLYLHASTVSDLHAIGGVLHASCMVSQQVIDKYHWYTYKRTGINLLWCSDVCYVSFTKTV